MISWVGCPTKKQFLGQVRRWFGVRLLDADSMLRWFGVRFLDDDWWSWFLVLQRWFLVPLGHFLGQVEDAAWLATVKL